MQIRLLGNILVLCLIVISISVVATKGSAVPGIASLRRHPWVKRHPAPTDRKAACHCPAVFSGKTSGVSGTTQIISEQRKISLSKLV